MSPCFEIAEVSASRMVDRSRERGNPGDGVRRTGAGKARFVSKLVPSIWDIEPERLTLLSSSEYESLL